MNKFSPASNGFNILFFTALLLTGGWCEVEGEEEGEEEDCSDKALFACAYPTELQNLRFSTSQKELDDMCRNFNNGMRCIDEYTRRCFKPHQRSHFNTLYSGTSMVMHEICNPGPYQKEFLKHAACMSNVTDEYELCAKHYQQKIDETMKETYSDGDQHVEKICCSLMDYLTCSKTIVRATCGEESETFAAGFLDKMSKAINMAHCKNFTSSSDVCNAGSRLHQIPYYNIIIVSFVTAVSILC